METPELPLADLPTHGLLLQHGKALPSLSAIVAGAPVHGSWWAHPQAHTIYALLGALAAHPDVLLVKLVLGKATFVHRRRSENVPLASHKMILFSRLIW